MAVGAVDAHQAVGVSQIPADQRATYEICRAQGLFDLRHDLTELTCRATADFDGDDQVTAVLGDGGVGVPRGLSGDRVDVLVLILGWCPG